ncbi:unnamed protein product [Choristocarpus tenellus]
MLSACYFHAILFPPCAPSPTRQTRLGFSFTPGGLLFPYHLGVAKALEENNFLAAEVPIAGSSAGALVCAVLGCNMSLDEAARGASEICADCREGGTQYRLRDVVEGCLERMLPEDAHDLINTRKGKVSLAMTNLWPLPIGGVFVDKFNSREDLIEVLLGSCCVPFWFSKYPFVQVRGKATVDGVFSLPRKYFGAPNIPSADQVVRVSVFPGSTLPVYSETEGDLISPDLLESATYERMTDSPSIPLPNRSSSSLLRYLELLKYALHPGTDEVLDELFDTGYQTGRIWIEEYGNSFKNGFLETVTAVESVESVEV